MNQQNPSSQLLASVVIPAYNAEHTIEQTLLALDHQDYPSIEIIVVDDGSTDQTAAKISAFKRVRYFHQPNAGPAAARNRGAEAAGGEVIFFTDSDCVPHPDWISAGMKHFENKDISVVAGSYGIANAASWLARGIHQEIRFRHLRLMPPNPRAFGSYNVAIRRHVWLSVGGFDPTFRHASGEDNDLSYKILRAGFKIHFDPTMLVDHHHQTGLWRYWREQYRHGYWRVYMYARHPTMMKGDDYTFWKDIIEPGLCGGFILFFLWGCFVAPMAVLAGVIFIIHLFIEIFYSWMFCSSWPDKIKFSLVMLARSYARTLGFSTGFLKFLLNFFSKKGNNY